GRRPRSRRRRDVQGQPPVPPEGRAARDARSDERPDCRARHPIPVLAAAHGDGLDDVHAEGVRGRDEARVHGPLEARRGQSVPAAGGTQGPRVPREGRAVREGRAAGRLIQPGGAAGGVGGAGVAGFAAGAGAGSGASLTSPITFPFTREFLSTYTRPPSFTTLPTTIP